MNQEPISEREHLLNEIQRLGGKLAVARVDNIQMERMVQENKELEELNCQLAERVRELTAQLAEREEVSV